MRIPKQFGKTTPHFKEPQSEKVKYIFVFEGSKTEVQYFEGVNESRALIGINPLIELMPLTRSVRHETESHPSRVFRLIEEHLDEYKTAKVFIDKIVDFCEDNKTEFNIRNLSNISISESLKYYFEDELDLRLDQEIVDMRNVLHKVSLHLECEFKISLILDDLATYIDDQQILYSEGYDQICIIIDRNKEKLNGYEYYLNKCMNKKYRLFVTNPDFEFWLLLHSDKVFEFDREMLFTNPKSGIDGKQSSKRYLENALSSVLNGYRKDRLLLEKLIPNIHNAIANEKKFCEDIECLENQLGSNVGLLIEEILK